MQAESESLGSMGTILDAIVAARKQDLAAARRQVPEEELLQRLVQAAPVRPFAQSLAQGPFPGIIAEVKRRSPSAGVLQDHLAADRQARAYAAGGATCISVLTESRHFAGSLHDLSLVRQTVSLPLLRKDFIVDPYQILEARVWGADAILLIAEILDGAQLVELVAYARRLGMDALVEFHEPQQLDKVLASGAHLIGINNRNLHTFHTDIGHTLALAPAIPGDRLLVSESGIRSAEDIRRLAQVGVRAFLVGEALVRAPDPTAWLLSLRCA